MRSTADQGISKAAGSARPGLCESSIAEQLRGPATPAEVAKVDPGADLGRRCSEGHGAYRAFTRPRPVAAVRAMCLDRQKGSGESGPRGRARVSHPVRSEAGRANGEPQSYAMGREGQFGLAPEPDTRQMLARSHRAAALPAATHSGEHRREQRRSPQVSPDKYRTVCAPHSYGRRCQSR